MFSIRDGLEQSSRQTAVRLSRGKDLIIYDPRGCLRREWRFAEARETARRALQAARSGATPLGNALRDEIALYETRPAIPQVKPGEAFDAGSFLSAVATKTDEPLSRGYILR